MLVKLFNRFIRRSVKHVNLGINGHIEGICSMLFFLWSEKSGRRRRRWRKRRRRKRERVAHSDR